MTKGLSKLVDFRMCKTCQHRNVPQDEDPCNECLYTPARDGEESHTPINYKPMDEENK